jgi:hypothetical protein
MADGSGDYRVLINRLRKSLQIFDVKAHRDESEPLPDQAYRLLTLLEAAALQRRMEVAGDSTLNVTGQVPRSRTFAQFRELESTAKN